MVPKIIAKGTSFKGAAQYLLHDKGGLESSERVAWTEVRNLMSDDPELAWRIMAATAMDQNRLKEQAGIPKTGRKSNKSVLHMSLAWHPEEAEGLTREEMISAATQAIKAIGAQDHQVLMVAHDDEDHPHLHILCNRVSPQNGVMLPSSNDRLKLSEWAQRYEQERGKIYCEDRVVNNERRQEGEYVKGQRDQSRHLIEAEKVARSASNDNVKVPDLVKATQIAQDRSLAQYSRKVSEARKTAWETLESSYKGKKIRLRDETASKIKASRQIIAEKFHPIRKELNAQFQDELISFDARDQTILGKAQNTFKALKLAKQLRGEDNHSQALGRVFRVLSTKGARREQVIKDQNYRKSLLRQEQRKEFETKKAEHVKWRDVEQAKLQESFLDDRAALELRHAEEHKGIKEAWRKRHADRDAAYKHALSPAPNLGRTFDLASRSKKQVSEDGETRADRIYNQIIEGKDTYPRENDIRDRDQDRER